MKIDFTKPYFNKNMKKDVLKNIHDSLNSNTLMLSSKSKKLEKLFSRIIGTKYSITVNSGTTGLQIALRYANVKNNEVIIPSASFITNVSSVLFEGGKPILVDCNNNSLTFNIDDLKKKINKKTKAIVWIHLAGYIGSEYKKIVEIAKKNKILLIEDASHAHGSSINGKLAGSIGDVGIFSLYPTKVLTAGTGGIITTNNKKIFELAKSLRIFGKNENSGEVENLGNDWFLDEFRCSVAYVQLKNLGQIVKKRQKAAAYYLDTLPKSEFYDFLNLTPDIVSNWYHFPIFFKQKIMVDQIILEFSKYHVTAKRIYKPVYEEKVFLKMNLGKNFYSTKILLDCSLCLPLYTSITKKEQKYVVQCFKKAIKNIKVE